MDGLWLLWQETGIANLTWQQLLMMTVGGGLLYLAIVRQFEPLLLLPIGFGAILSNIQRRLADCCLHSRKHWLPDIVLYDRIRDSH